MSAPDADPFPNPALADVRASLTVAKKELVNLLHTDTFRRYRQPFLDSIEKKYEEFLSSDNENVVANAKRKMKKEEQVYKCKAAEFERNFIAEDGMHSKDFKEYAAKNHAADSVEAILLIHRMENLEVEFERKFRKLALVFWEKHQDPHGRMPVNLPNACSESIAVAFSRYELDQDKNDLRRQAKAQSKEAGKKAKEEAKEEAEEEPKKEATKKKKKDSESE